MLKAFYQGKETADKTYSYCINKLIKTRFTNLKPR